MFWETHIEAHEFTTFFFICRKASMEKATSTVSSFNDVDKYDSTLKMILSKFDSVPKLDELTL